MHGSKTLEFVKKKLHCRYAPHEGVWGGGIAPLILKLRTRRSYRGLKHIRMKVLYMDREVQPLPASKQIASSELLRRFS